MTIPSRDPEDAFEPRDHADMSKSHFPDLSLNDIQENCVMSCTVGSPCFLKEKFSAFRLLPLVHFLQCLLVQTLLPGACDIPVHRLSSHSRQQKESYNGNIPPVCRCPETPQSQV